MLYDATGAWAAKRAWRPARGSTPGRRAGVRKGASSTQTACGMRPRICPGNTRTIIKLAKAKASVGPISSIRACSARSLRASRCARSGHDQGPGDRDCGLPEETRALAAAIARWRVLSTYPSSSGTGLCPQIVKCDLCRSTNLKDKGYHSLCGGLPGGSDHFREARRICCEKPQRGCRDSPRLRAPYLRGARGGREQIILYPGRRAL